MHLGEAMVSDGLITGDTLEKALERQLIFGGRLGSNLVELGAISWEELARFMGKVLGVPYAGPEQFEEVSKEALEAFPVDLARKYSAFPIKKERSRLHLAMRYPDDISALDDIRFILGLDVKSWVAPEIQVFNAIERYYGKSADEQPASGQPDLAPEENAAEPPVVGEPAAEPATEPARPAPCVEKDEAPLRPEPAKLENPYERLASPSCMEDITEATVSAAKASLARAAMFMVKDGAVTCWNASGFGADGGEIEITLDAPSIFKDVVEDKIFYRGPVIPVPQNRRLLERLGGEAPLEAIAYPLVIRGKTVGVLYGDGGEGSMMNTDARGLEDLMAKASASLEILILRNKILSVE